MKILQNPRKFKNSPNLLLLFVKITKFLEFSKKITIKTIVFSNSGLITGTGVAADGVRASCMFVTFLHAKFRVCTGKIFFLNFSKIWIF